VNNNKNNLGYYTEDQLWNEKEGGVIVHDDSFFFLSLHDGRHHTPYIYIVGTHARVHPACLLQTSREYTGLGTLSLSLSLLFSGPLFFSTSAGLYPRKIVIIERDYSHMNMNGKNSPHGGKVFFYI
jgi:hypothetical protein